MLSFLLCGSFHHRIISFVVVCYGFVVVAGVYMFFLLVPCLFVVDALHSSCYCLSFCVCFSASP